MQMCYCYFPLGTNACMHIDLRPVAENKRLGEMEGKKMVLPSLLVRRVN
jgi:hypothetical protein